MNTLAHTDIRWLASFSANCFYAAEAVVQGRARAGCDLAAVIAEPAEALAKEIDYQGLPADAFWRQLVPLSAQIESNRELAEVALAKTVRMDDRTRSMIDPLATRIAEVEAAALRVFPGLLDDVAERSEPLRGAWDLRGPGLLAGVARLTDERLVVPRADAVLLWPVFGGGGRAYLSYNSVLLETVQGDPVAGLPEVVRLAWLVVQLNVDLPMFSELIHPDRVPLVAAAAMLPPVLAAAEELELARCDGPTVRAALAASDLDFSPASDPCDVLLEWWQTYLASRPAWNVALAALDQMLLQAEPPDVPPMQQPEL
jgi:hypothetical protein